ncbi:MAG: TIGR00296 family protein [Nitrosopumilus sp.]|nr:TIGR00296 family protein [Nitrosopumilus sp.]MDH5568900.1 TIGR00296 family protein [Nitrosopumilus sp.]
MKKINQISNDDGKKLVKMARKAVERYLENNSKINDLEFNSKFDYKSGVFVTINKRNALRGCIGYPIPVKKLADGLVDAAISAATQDPRFTPVDVEELDQIIFEVTVLTPPIELIADHPNEYLSMIKVGRDGLIVENAYTSGLLLPQVPTEYGWNVKEFLEFACEKAGLDKDTWKDKTTKVSRFEGVIFKEESPNGKIIRESSNDFL